MTDGLITRIGKWIDRKWQGKVTELEFIEAREMTNRTLASLNDSVILIKDILKEQQAKIDAHELSMAGFATRGFVNVGMEEVKARLEAIPAQENVAALAKDIADMKTRFEKLELYLGMARKVDPTKPAVAKSAFSM